MSTINYFAYGSNMSTRRLRARTPSAEVVSVATLSDHKLAFHKVSTNDGSGKCDIVETHSERVLGVLFEIERGQKSELDLLEGLNQGYREKFVDLELSCGSIVRATTYVAININTSLKPFTWYKRHVIEGAREAKLPESYLQALKGISAVEDHDKAREARELAIYG